MAPSENSNVGYFLASLDSAFGPELGTGRIIDPNFSLSLFLPPLVEMALGNRPQIAFLDRQLRDRPTF